MPNANDACFRAITIDAPASIVFRWLCQMKVAPYSYDWIDNLGRRSPQELVPGAEQLEVGQRFMFIFGLVDFAPDRHLTLVLDRAHWMFGEVALSYVVSTERSGDSRLVVKLLVNHPGPRFLRPVVRQIGPLGDLVMMRRQLLNFKGLAERDASLRVSPPASRP